MKNLPKKIYLQVGEDCYEKDFKQLDSRDITWCEDRINKNDIVYYLRRKKLK